MMPGSQGGKRENNIFFMFTVFFLRFGNVYMTKKLTFLLFLFSVTKYTQHESYQFKSF